MADAVQMKKWARFARNKDRLDWWEDKLVEANGAPLGEYLENVEFGDAGISAVEYENIYSQLLKRPGEDGEQLQRRGGAPLKSDLIAKANAAEVWQAFGEILDNLLDNYDGAIEKIREEREPDKHDLRVEIRFVEINGALDTNKNGEIQIEENSGGVFPARRDALVQPGNSKWEDVEESVGVWGNGSKVAMLKLGRWNIIQTYPIKGEPGSDPYPVQLKFGDKHDWDEDGGMGDTIENGRWTLPKNYYHHENSYWHVQEFKATSGYCLVEGPGTTCINIRRLRSAVLREITNDDLYEKMITQLQRCFGKKIEHLKQKHGQDIQILFLNSAAPNPDLRRVELTENIPANFAGNWESDMKLFSWIPGIQPEIHKIQLKIPTKNPLKMEVRIGFPLENSESTRGFSMWGNQRLFETNWCDIKGSGRKGTQHWNFGKNVQNGRCRGMIFFEGDPADIPWQGPVKWKFRDTHHYASLVKDTLKWIVTKYTTASKFNLDNDNLLDLFKRT